MLKRRIALVGMTIGVICTFLGIVGYVTNTQVNTAWMLGPGLLGLLVGFVALFAMAWGTKKP